MEVLRSDKFIVIRSQNTNLWINRHSSQLEFDSNVNTQLSNDFKCIGICHGIIGKLNFDECIESCLLLIKEYTKVGFLFEQKNAIYKIKSISLIGLKTDQIFNDLCACSQHPISTTVQKVGAFSKTFSTLKQNTQNVAYSAANQIKSRIRWPNTNSDFNNDSDTLRKRLLDEIQKFFADNESFYYSYTYDLTNSLQKNHFKFSWKSINQKFCWNYVLLKDFALDELDSDANNNRYLAQFFIPLIQGFIQIEPIVFPKTEFEIKNCFLSLISRRSRYRAGTRYKKRGVDDDGNCANYVETEQILIFNHEHKISFVQVRGSIPIYWSQPGLKYRPPPQIDRNDEVTKIAFKKHFDAELKSYESIRIINLIQQCGKEKILWEKYTDHLFYYNNKNITYISFDFQEFCRGMHFENVIILLNAIEEVIQDMRYFWLDNKGEICQQSGVFRVNCVDCLDRTNVVQTAIGEFVLKIQLTKLGLFVPGDTLFPSIKKVFQEIWANNGDVLSKQYAGTNALKGDFTRTGERKFSGLMKDGVKSANRYYLSRFKDSYRQGIIDILQGNPVSYEIFNENNKQIVDEEEEGLSLTLNQIQSVIDDYKIKLDIKPEKLLGCWGLISCKNLEDAFEESEMNTVLILTEEVSYFMDYIENSDQAFHYYVLRPDKLVAIDLGIMEFNSSFFVKKSVTDYCLRIQYMESNTNVSYYIFRSANIHFFNNTVTTMNSSDEKFESLKAMCEAFLVVRKLQNLSSLPFKIHDGKLKLKESKTLPTNEDVYFNEKLDSDKRKQIFEKTTAKNVEFLPNIGIVMTGDSFSNIQIDHESNSSILKSSLTVDDSNKRSSSYYNIANELLITQSKSDNVVNKGLKLDFRPISNTTKDLVLNPLAKLAKNVQNFANNLDVSHPNRKQNSDREVEQCRKMLEKWSNCQTKLIIL